MLVLTGMHAASSWGQAVAHATATMPPSEEQVGFADRILITKTDVAGAGEVDTLRRRLAKMNPRARLARPSMGWHRSTIRRTSAAST